MAHRPQFASVLVALTMLVGCTTSPDTLPDQVPFKATGSVDGTILETSSSDQYQAKLGESFLRPQKVLTNAKPAYPASALATRMPPIEIQIRIVVSADGIVTSTEALQQADDQSKPFLDAVVSAVSTWRFYPLYKIDASGNAVKLPFHQDYSFTFKQIDGKGVVSESPGQS